MLTKDKNGRDVMKVKGIEIRHERPYNIFLGMMSEYQGALRCQS